MGWAEKAVKGSLRLIVVTPDGVEESERCPVVHQTVARADTPKRRRSHTVGRRKSLCDVDRPQVLADDEGFRARSPCDLLTFGQIHCVRSGEVLERISGQSSFLV